MLVDEADDDIDVAGDGVDDIFVVVFVLSLFDRSCNAVVRSSSIKYPSWFELSVVAAADGFV